MSFNTQNELYHRAAVQAVDEQQASATVMQDGTPPPGASEASSPEEVRSKAASLAAGPSSGAASLTASPAGLSARSDEARAREAVLVGSARDSIEMAYGTRVLVKPVVDRSKTQGVGAGAALGRGV